MTPLVPGRNIVLGGMMGAGKSAVGRLLAARLGREFFDTDVLVEREAGVTVRELFSTRGERGFRELEAEAVRGVATLRGRVIAVGGGALTVPANVTQLRSTGDIVLLDADAETLAKRLAGQADHGRPLLDGAEASARLAQLRADRDGAYRSAAATVIDTASKTPEGVADEVLAWAVQRPGLLAPEERSG